MTITEKLEIIVKKLKTRKSKNIIYVILAVFFASWFGYRFCIVSGENNTDVFNIVRDNLQNGTPVETVQATKIDGVLYEPITVKNNRAYIAGGRIGLFYAGQSLGDCRIASVSNNIDLDTGMHVIKTSNCSDGLKYAENKQNGFFIPVSALHGNTVYVVVDNMAHAQNVETGGRDTQNVLIKSGINDGDLIILSDVSDNQKIKIVK